MHNKRGCTYPYTLSLDMTKIADAIIERLPGDEYEWWVEDDKLIIKMSDRATADIWYSPQTYYEPEEYDIELINSVDDVDVYTKIVDGIRSVLDAEEVKDKLDYVCEIDIDNIEVDEPPEPDPDRAYDEWKDRQFEDD